MQEEQISQVNHLLEEVRLLNLFVFSPLGCSVGLKLLLACSSLDLEKKGSYLIQKSERLSGKFVEILEPSSCL